MVAESKAKETALGVQGINRLQDMFSCEVDGRKLVRGKWSTAFSARRHVHSVIFDEVATCVK